MTEGIFVGLDGTVEVVLQFAQRACKVVSLAIGAWYSRHDRPIWIHAPSLA